MFDKRCSLCGGKLKGNICTECGLDNSKSDANYVSSGSTHHLGEELTHEHKDNENPMAGKTVTREWINQEKKAEKARKQGTKKTASQTYQSAGGSSSTYQSAGSSSSTYQSGTYSSQSKERRKRPFWGKIITIIIVLSICSSIVGAIKDDCEDWRLEKDE